MTAIDDLTRLHHMQDAAREAMVFMSGKIHPTPIRVQIWRGASGV